MSLKFQDTFTAPNRTHYRLYLPIVFKCQTVSWDIVRSGILLCIPIGIPCLLLYIRAIVQSRQPGEVGVCLPSKKNAAEYFYISAGDLVTITTQNIRCLLFNPVTKE